ncbi:hypothetical protein BDZ89DRAFT_1137418 [Hymenopellis radicata]|nr:hypothetical protein BDZ89DRAFT_1137418 [Hymenopellis radicata]
MVNISSYAAAPLLGSHLNIFLYTSELAMTFWYIRNFKTIPMYKYGIYASVVTDGLASLFVIANVYLYLIAMSDYDVNWKQGNHNSTRMANAGTHHSQLRVRDNRAMLLYVPVLVNLRDKYMTAFLTFMILGHVVCILTTAIYILCPHFHRRACRIRSYNSSEPRFVLGTDILIAASLAWALEALTHHYSSTKLLLRRNRHLCCLVWGYHRTIHNLDGRSSVHKLQW